MAKDADTAFPRHTINTAADALGEAAMMLEAIRLGYTFSAREYNDRLGLIRLHMSDKQRSRLHQRLIVGEKSANTGAAGMNAQPQFHRVTTADIERDGLTVEQFEKMRADLHAKLAKARTMGAAVMDAVRRNDMPGCERAQAAMRKEFRR